MRHGRRHGCTACDTLRRFRAVGLSRNRREAGFAIVAVVWGLGLIAILAVAVFVGTRYRVKSISNAIALESGELAGQTAVHLAILKVQSADAAFWRNPFIRCRLPDDTSIDVAVERETGKVDLNAAAGDLLARLFTALAGAPTGARIAANIVTFREPDAKPLARDMLEAYVADGRPEGPKRHPFLSVLELDQVLGMTPELMRRAMPFVTVHSGRKDVDPAAAAPVLIDLLGLHPGTAAGPGEAADASVVTIRADVHGTRGVHLAREAIVSFGVAGRPYVIDEWRQGDRDPSHDLEDDRERPATACFR